MPSESSRTTPPEKENAVKSVSEALNDEIGPYWLAAIIESAEDAIVSKTLDGVIASWNKGAERIFGYSAEEAVGNPVTMLIPPNHLNEEPEILSRIRKGQRVEHYETVRVRKDGQRINVSLTVSPIKDATGKVIGASKIARDITERKRIEARLSEALQQAEEARTRAEEASRLKDEFLATVSHELRTPLTSMMGWVAMLRSGILSRTDTIKALETVERNTKAQAQLVEDLLDISRIVSGTMHLDIKTVAPAAIINIAVDAIRPAAEAKKIDLQMMIDPDAGPVPGDYERLQQVVWNLLSNAVKFTPEGGRVKVELQQVGSDVEITVSDNGKGIQPKFLPFAFDHFSQADGSITRAFGGMGLGLAIVKSVVELHGGNVRATSDGEGQGATFIVSLPVISKEQGARQTERAETMQANSTTLDCPPALEGLRILVVDDELDTCEMVSTAFKKCRAKVKIATSAAAALGQMEEWLPDILVADISMPGMDGYELVRQIRMREPQAGGNVPAVALTAMARIEDRVKVLASGFQMHVAKPVELGELRAVVASLASLIIEKK